MTAAELKQHIDIVAVIGDRLQLDKRGDRYWAVCPFHEEKTASFCISPDRQRFYCFGCHESGDVIDFLQKYHGISFRAACRMLDPDFHSTRMDTRPHKEPKHVRLWKYIDLWQQVFFAQITPFHRQLILDWAIDRYHPCMHPMTLKLWQYRRWLKWIKDKPDEQRKYKKALARWKARQGLYEQYNKIQSEDDLVRFMVTGFSLMVKS